jgi:hypothetical protein
VRRTLLAALFVLAAAACGGNKTTTASCPSGDVCTPVTDGGPSSTMGGGVTVIATQIQATATSLASDGTSLYWLSSVGAGGPISKVPVGGGAVTTDTDGLAVTTGGSVGRHCMTVKTLVLTAVTLCSSVG